MKLIAHRNETPGCPENSLASLVHSARPGIYAVECDVRSTGDGRRVIYHDDTLRRLAGDGRRVDKMTLSDMRAALARVGRSVMTLDELIDGWTSRTPVLLHIKERMPSPGLLEPLRAARMEFIFGVESPAMLAAVRAFAPDDHILAFMPDMRMYPEFIAGGAGIIRLWEPWLDSVTPDMVHAAGAGQVWIMCQTPAHGMDGTPESLSRIEALRADGALISDVDMGLNWQARRASAPEARR